METLRTSGRTSRNRKRCSKLRWTNEEDKLLVTLIQKYGPAKWNHIATHVQGRSGKSCRIRWFNQLHPRIDKRTFSPEEKRRLLLLHREFGNRWSVIASYIPGRTDNQVKNQYHLLVGRFKKGEGEGESSNNDIHGNLDDGSRGSPPYAVFIGSQFSDVTSLGTRPSLTDGSSSVYGKAENSTDDGASSSLLSSLGSHPHQRERYGNSIISDPNSAVIQGNQFIDFLGVGSSN